MLLPHLIPHIEAEIARLQKARDLLATDSNSDTNYLVTAQRLQAHLDRSTPDQARERLLKLQAVATPETETASGPAYGTAVILPPVTYLKGRRRLERRSEPRLQRKKQVAVIDTALSGTVPDGPVVVSAEQVRKSQAAKTAQSERAAEVKKADGEFASVLSWRSRSEESSSLDSMLQRLMQMGKSQDGNDGADPLASFGGRGRLASLRAPLAPESD